jgi:hypothetical protein
MDCMPCCNQHRHMYSMCTICCMFYTCMLCSGRRSTKHTYTPKVVSVHSGTPRSLIDEERTTARGCTRAHACESAHVLLSREASVIHTCMHRHTPHTHTTTSFTVDCDVAVDRRLRRRTGNCVCVCVGVQACMYANTHSCMCTQE